MLGDLVKARGEALPDKCAFHRGTKLLGPPLGQTARHKGRS